MKSLLGVLCLGLVLVHSRADHHTNDHPANDHHTNDHPANDHHTNDHPANDHDANDHHQDCHKTLGPNELHQLDGDWVLVGSILDKRKGALEELPDMTSSHLETRVQSDNHTLTVHERNVYSGGKCVEYTFDLVLSQEPHGDGHDHLDLANAMETKDGVTKNFTDKGDAQFFQSNKDTVLMAYHSEKYGYFVAVYSREGQHLDDTEKHQEELRALAKCLKMEGENFVEWDYHGGDFCHKKSVLPTLDSDELHQVDGHWVLIWMVYDKLKSHDDPALHFNSSHLELHVQADNHTVSLHERNLMGDHCVSYEGNLVLPQDSEKIHRLHLGETKQTINGVETTYQDNATAEFFPSPDNTLEFYYRSEKYGRFLLHYRREGQHVDDLEKDHDKYREMAKYLGLSGENFVEWHYEGLADFCHKKSVLHTLGSDELHQVHGDWLLFFSTYNKVKSQEEHWVNITSSHMEFRLHPDNHTVHMNERNLVGEKTYVYKGNLVLPQHSEKIHSLHLNDPKLVHDNVETSHDDTATAEFFESSENTLLLFYKSKTYGNFLLYYRKEGQDLDVKELVTEHEKYRERAKYLGMHGGDYEEWEYKIPAPQS